MSEWKKTSCVLCAQNCGLEVIGQGSKILKVRADRENPRSRGFICRKGANIAFFQNNPDRLKYPLKRVGSRFERISWRQALDEIAAKIKEIREIHGPRSLAYMGGGGQGCHFQLLFALPLLRGLGSYNYYSALAQEHTGLFWVEGKAFGRQNMHTSPDVDGSDFFVCWGSNPMVSNRFPRAPLVIRNKKTESGFLLGVVDPRKTETAKLADIHLQLRPGTDALLLKAVIKILLAEGLWARDYVTAHVNGFEEIRGWFDDVDVEENCRLCELDPEAVRKFTRLLATRKTAIRSDLGAYMGRHSTLNSYLELILLSLTGRIGARGGNVFPGHLAGGGAHTPEEDPNTWRTEKTNIPLIMGLFPPNVMPEEIDNDHPRRLRALIVANSNPLRSYADTKAYERSFAKLDLLVTIELAMTETAVLSHYVLPAKSGYEKWDSTFFQRHYPEYYFHMRPPVVEAEGEAVEEAVIYLGLAERLGLIPEYPAKLRELARDRSSYGPAFREYLQANPKAAPWAPYILAQTLGKELGSNNLAVLWMLVHQFVQTRPEDVARAGLEAGPATGEEIFQKILDTPGGVKIGVADTENNLSRLETPDKKVHIHFPEMQSWVKEVQPAAEEALLGNKEYPMILMAGNHMDMVANTNMRDPAWNEGRRACTLRIHSADAANLGIKDGEAAVVETEAGSAKVEIEITDSSHRGQVVIPHGFGLVHMEKVYGVNSNQLTSARNRDRIAATPLHRYIPCRVCRAQKP
ncbi:MAG: anaerobic dehydrogenase, typically selenocysteine-containing [Deltaproteobacteria bacterium]|nr:anaerobic dehydrogenase, typically selenocysteine-containing [Deltaproteobacteria bacterium]